MVMGDSCAQRAIDGTHDALRHTVPPLPLVFETGKAARLRYVYVIPTVAYRGLYWVLRTH